MAATDPRTARPGGQGDPSEPFRQARRYRTPLAWAKAADLAVYRQIRRLAHEPRRVRAARAFSGLGEHAMLWLGLGAVGIVLDRERSVRWARASATVGLAHACSSTIKIAIGRRRPAVEDLPHLMATPTGLSFPSSHSASSFAAARAFGALLPSPPLYGLAAAMAFSRLYLGVHYPSDIAAGTALGLAVGTVGR